MRSRTRRYIWLLSLFALLVAVLAAGCSSTQRIDLSLDGAGTAAVQIRLSPFLVSYLQDLAATVSGTAPSKDQPVFDLAALREAFARYPDLTLLDAATPSIDTLTLTIRFSDASRLLSGVSGGGFINFSRNGAERTLSIRLDREAVGQLLQLTPLSGSVAGNILLPPKDAAMSEKEYASYLAWALEDYTTGKNVEQTITDSSLDVAISVAGTLVSVSGGRRSGNSAQFSIPVVRLLTLQKPVIYSLTFR